MAKRLKHTIGTDKPIQFTIKAVDFAGVKTPKNLTGNLVYFELERDGIQILAKDNDGVGGVVLTDAVAGVCVATIDKVDMPAELGGEVDYAVLTRDDPAGDDDRDEVIRGKLELVLELVDVP